MKLELLPMLRCPDCGAELELQNEKMNSEEVTAGDLACRKCAAVFPLSERGVPQLLPSALTRNAGVDEDFKRKKIEMQTRDEQVEVYDKLPGLSLLGKIEIPLMMKSVSLQKSDVLLEGGCGNGRMTQQFADNSKLVVALDFSLASLHMNQQRLKAAEIKNVHLLQADLSYLPLADNTFDAILSCQVIEHLPSHEARAMAIKGFGRVGKADARVAVSGYKYNLFERLFGSKEGEHPGNIPYFRFTRQEFKELMEESLQVEKINGALIYCWVASCKNVKNIPVLSGARS